MVPVRAGVVGIQLLLVVVGEVRCHVRPTVPAADQAVEDEQMAILGAAALAPIRTQLALDALEQLRVDDGFMLTVVLLVLVTDQQSSI